jgi:tetratricopeptide (TPR) repeat protein
MYSVIFKDIILEINDDHAKSMKTLVIYCQQKHIPETEINEFKCMYHQKSPVWWYTKEMFLYGMLNRALRSLDMEAMTKLGFFIRSLHLQLKQLHQEQSANFNKSFTVYRGQGLTQEDFTNLTDSKGGLLSFNNFLSTSRKREVAMRFVRDSLYKNNKTVGVMFIMTIDPSKISTETTPFAMIDDYTAVRGEEEILFTMHTVFRVGEIKQTVDNKRLCEVQLSITDDNDPQLAILTDRIKEEVRGSNGWFRMGKLMTEMGHFNQAEALHDELLKNASSDTDRAYIYHRLGGLKDKQGKYQEAVAFFEKSLEIKEKSLPTNHPDLAESYNNIGMVYNHMGEYSKALQFYEKSIQIRKISLPPNHPDLAESYNNIGLVCHNMGDYSKALKLYEKSIKIKEISLPPNHPALATSYGNMGLAYYKMGDYSAALEVFEQDLEIKKKTLPPTHSLLATAYNNIGVAYNSMGDYSKALEFYEKSHQIWDISLSPTHPSLAASNSNIGLVCQNMGDYSKALEFYEKALKIREKALPPNHPDLASTYEFIGGVYDHMGDYSKTLAFYEKALKIREKALPPTHLDLATNYNNIGLVYNNMGDYSKALAFYEKALAIFRNSLPPTHPNIKVMMNNIQIAKKNL